MSSVTIDDVVRETDRYSVRSALPFADFDGFPAGASVLVCGPAMIGKRTLATDLLKEGLEANESAVVVTTNRSARRLEPVFDGYDGERYYVDCTGTGGWGDETDRAKFVSNPGDLTGIGIALAKVMRSLAGTPDEGTRTAFLSLSTIQQYAGSKRLFNFLHVLGGRLSTANYLNVGTFDPNVVDPATANTVRSLYDYVVELREREPGVREVRVVGMDVRTGWQEL